MYGQAKEKVFPGVLTNLTGKDLHNNRANSLPVRANGHNNSNVAPMDLIPEELKALPQWVNWEHQFRNGKRTKVPYRAGTTFKAKSTKPATWGPFEDAVNDGRGIGFAFSEADPYVGIDIDNGIDEKGNLSPRAQETLDRFPGTYAELSPSGKGIHIWIKGSLDGLTGRKIQGLGLEVYDRGRFFTMTGNRLPGRPSEIRECQSELVEWHNKYWPRKPKGQKALDGNQKGATGLTADEAIERAHNAKNGAQFRTLFTHGDTREFPSASEADLALASHLTFWLGNAPEAIEQAMRQSALVRDKWDSHPDYLQRTIQKAIDGTKEFFSPTEAAWESRFDADLIQFGPHDAGNAEAVAEVYGDRFAHNSSFGTLYYNGRFWQREGAEARLTQAVVEVLKERRKQAVDANREDIVQAAKPSGFNVRNAIFLFKADSRVQKSVEQFDNYPDHLNVANGVLDLRTGELAPHSPQWHFTYCLDVAYDPEADQTAWVGFLREAVADPDIVLPYLQESVGYSLTGHTREECLWYLWGPRRGGKGTFTETLNRLLGHPLSMAVDFNIFTMARRDANNFVLAPLKASRLVTAGESENTKFMNAAFVKKMTGGDYINAAFKGKDHFTYKPTFKIWLASNFPVKIDVEDDAAWGRVKVIHFPHSHFGQEDKTLKQRMTQRANLEGVLAWAVEGAKRWYASGARGLVTPEAVELMGQGHRDELDEASRFLEEETEEAPGNFVANPVLYQAYTEYCQLNGFTPKPQRSLGWVLKRKGFENGSERMGGKVHRGWYGFRLIGRG